MLNFVVHVLLVHSILQTVCPLVPVSHKQKKVGVVFSFWYTFHKRSVSTMFRILESEYGLTALD